MLAPLRKGENNQRDMAFLNPNKIKRPTTFAEASKGQC